MTRLALLLFSVNYFDGKVDYENWKGVCLYSEYVIIKWRDLSLKKKKYFWVWVISSRITFLNLFIFVTNDAFFVVENYVQCVPNVSVSKRRIVTLSVWYVYQNVHFYLITYCSFGLKYFTMLGKAFK